MKKRLTFSALGTGVLLLVGDTSASPARAPMAAQVLFEKGRAALARNEVAEACALFAESLRLDEAVGTLFNLAACVERQGKVASAWEHLRESVDRLAPGDDRNQPALARARALESRLPRIEIRLATNSAVDPGRHRIVTTLPGRPEVVTEISLAEGETKVVLAHAGQRQSSATSSRVATPPERPEPEPATAAPYRTLGFVSLGLGVAGLGLGAVTGPSPALDVLTPARDARAPVASAAAMNASMVHLGEEPLQADARRDDAARLRPRARCRDV